MILCFVCTMVLGSSIWSLTCFVRFGFLGGLVMVGVFGEGT